MARVYPLPKLAHPDFADPNRKPVGPVKLRQNVSFLALFQNSSGTELKSGIGPTTIGGNASIGANAGEMSAAFDGADDYITWGTQIPALDMSLPWVVFAKIKLDSFIDTYPCFFSCYEAENADALSFGASNGANYTHFYIFKNGGTRVQERFSGISAGIDDGLWHTVVFVYDKATGSGSPGTAGNVQLYMDASESSTNSNSGGLESYTNEWSCGHLGGKTYGDWNGEVSFAGAISGEAWTEPQARAFIREPYRYLLEPAIPMTYFVQTAAPATGDQTIYNVVASGGVVGAGNSFIVGNAGVVG